MTTTANPINRPLHGAIRWVRDLARKRRAGPGLAPPPRDTWSDATLAVHAGSIDDPRTGAVGTPIYQNTTFILDDDDCRAIEEGWARDRLIYTRYGNPSQWAVQNKLAALEHAESALVVSSGMAAVTGSILSLIDAGAHVVASNELYGGSYNLFLQEFPTLGLSSTLVDPRDLGGIESAIRPETQLLYFEAVTNPLLKVVDIPALVDLARRHRVRLIIDATFATPLGCRPLDLGADLVVHSASKYLSGHSDVIAGVIAGSRKLVDVAWPRVLTYGGCLDPHACFLLERSLKTLPLRMKVHQSNAVALARYLESHPKVQRVRHPLLDSHEDCALAREILGAGIGMVSFDVSGGDRAAFCLARALSIPKYATSLGGLESLISLPFNTSHASFTADQRLTMGIHPGCVRLSVGVENIDDLISDFAQALDRLPERSAP